MCMVFAPKQMYVLLHSESAGVGLGRYQDLTYVHQPYENLAAEKLISPLNKDKLKSHLTEEARLFKHPNHEQLFDAEDDGLIQDNRPC